MNSEKYSDPTAEQAIAHVMREQRTKKKQKKRGTQSVKNYDMVLSWELPKDKIKGKEEQLNEQSRANPR